MKCKILFLNKSNPFSMVIEARGCTTLFNFGLCVVVNRFGGVVEKKPLIHRRECKSGKERK